MVRWAEEMQVHEAGVPEGNTESAHGCTYADRQESDKSLIISIENNDFVAGKAQRNIKFNSENQIIHNKQQPILFP